MSEKDRSTLVTLSGLHSPLLGNSRDAYVYLPPEYEDSTISYPVLYMHVGQHVFEPSKQSGESWGMHIVADRLIASGLIEPIIIVAVEHKYEEGESEYFHDLSAFPIRCVGERYEHFLIHVLKPLIDQHFRTLPEAEKTALMGSSAAGLATYNIGLRNPNVFGMLGILSPFFVQVDPFTFEESAQYKLYPRNEGQKIWLDIGEAEGYFMPAHVRKVANDMLQAGWIQGEELYYFEERDAAHSEWDWGSRAHMPLLHFFGESGTAVEVELEGPPIVGIDGPDVYVNAVVKLDHGLHFNDLKGNYEVDRPEVLTVASDGRLYAKQPGEATVTYRYGELQVERMYTVVESLSETVTIELEIHVPESTPEDAQIYMTFEVPKLRKGLYGGSIRLKRGLTFAFLITRGYDMEEADHNYGIVPFRRLIADSDKKVSYTVCNWMDLKPKPEAKG